MQLITACFSVGTAQQTLLHYLISQLAECAAGAAALHRHVLPSLSEVSQEIKS